MSRDKNAASYQLGFGADNPEGDVVNINGEYTPINMHIIRVLLCAYLAVKLPWRF